MTARGAPKPSLRAFMLPLVRASRSGERTTVWGQVRPRNGVQPYRFQELRKGRRWQWLGPRRLTRRQRLVQGRGARRGRDTRLRIWSPQDAMYGNTLRVK